MSDSGRYKQGRPQKVKEMPNAFDSIDKTNSEINMLVNTYMHPYPLLVLSIELFLG